MFSYLSSCSEEHNDIVGEQKNKTDRVARNFLKAKSYPDD